MIELTPLERFQLKCAARRERLLRKIRWEKALRGSVHRELARRRLAGEIGNSDYFALRAAQRITPRNEFLRKMAEERPPSTSAYAGDDSWD
jgi:hypothetical protein